AGITGFSGPQPASDWTFTGNHIWNIGTAGTSSLNGQVYPPMGNGIHQNGVSNAINKYNLVHDMAANYGNPGAGPVAFTTNNCSGCIFRFNEGYRVRPTNPPQAMVDFMGVDFDTTTTNALAEYNFMHGNFNCGYYFFCTGSDWNSNAFRYNIGYN